MTAEAPEVRRILVRSTNWIGDAVMSLAALRELRQRFPDAHLTVFARDWVSDIYCGQGLADEIVSFPGNQSSLRHSGRLRGNDMAVLFQNAFEAALLSFFARIPQRLGYATQGRGFLLTRRAQPRTPQLGRHQAYYYLDLLHQLGLSSRDYLNDPDFSPDISLRPTESGSRTAKQLLHEAGWEEGQMLVGINPGATYGPAKRWLTDRYAALADRLALEFGAHILIVGSASERILAEQIESLMRARPTILSGRTDLQSLIASISRCRLFVTNDSGPMHLAAALDVPQIALFGSTDEVATGPLSGNARVVHKHVECSPCLRRECPIDLRCFGGISVNEVFEIAQEVLHETEAPGSIS